MGRSRIDSGLDIGGTGEGKERLGVDDLKKVIRYKSLAALFLVAFMIRMVFSLFIYDHPERVISPDSPLYISLAESLLDSQTFPSVFRTPVYPSFIALIYGVFGHFPQAVIMAQSFLDSLTAIFVIFICLEIFKKVRYAYGAGFLYAVTPFAVFYSNMILSETLFTCILVASVYFFIVFLDKRKMHYIVVSSVFLGAGVLCRPIALYLPLLLAPFIFMSGFRLRDRLIPCLICLFSFSIILIPWYMKNHYQHEYWGISTVKDIDMFYYEAPAALMIRDNPLSVIQPAINEPLYIYQLYLWERVRKKYGWREKNQSDVIEDAKKNAILREEGNAIIKENIPIILLSHTVGIGRTLCPYPPHFENLTGSPVTIVRGFAFLLDVAITILSLSGIIAIVRGAPNTRVSKIATGAMIFLLFYFTFIPGIMGYSRFKIPVLPLICIFASFGMGIIRREIQRTK